LKKYKKVIIYKRRRGGVAASCGLRGLIKDKRYVNSVLSPRGVGPDRSGPKGGPVGPDRSLRSRFATLVTGQQRLQQPIDTCTIAAAMPLNQAQLTRQSLEDDAHEKDILAKMPDKFKLVAQWKCLPKP
jgi:hypothetical protein